MGKSGNWTMKGLGDLVGKEELRGIGGRGWFFEDRSEGGLGLAPVQEREGGDGNLTFECGGTTVRSEGGRGERMRSC